MSNSGRWNRLKIAGFVCVFLLVATVSFTAGWFSEREIAPAVSAKPASLNVKISPDNVKLSPNQAQTFTASVENMNETVGIVTYVWTVEDTDGRFLRDGIFTNYEFAHEGEMASFTFLSA